MLTVFFCGLRLTLRLFKKEKKDCRANFISSQIKCTINSKTAYIVSKTQDTQHYYTTSNSIKELHPQLIN